MSRDEYRSRIPTGQELDRSTAVAPLGVGGPARRRGLLGFLRAGKIRVSGDVAARKYVAVERRPQHGATGPALHEASQADQVVRISTPAEKLEDRPGLTPRRIRIDPSVRERRGLGGSSGRP